jgi:hypothetical protein
MMKEVTTAEARSLSPSLSERMMGQDALRLHLRRVTMTALRDPAPAAQREEEGQMKLPAKEES